MKTWIVILLSLLFQTKPAQALVEVPTFRLGLGYSMISFGAFKLNQDPLFPDGTALGSMMTLSPSFLWDIPQVRSRIGFHFLADIGSKYGFVSIIGVGIDYLFYPMGLSSSREVKDDGSLIVKTRISPYFQFQITPEKMSITAPSLPGSTSARDYFNVLLVETSLGAGVDYPIGDNTIIFAGLHYRFAGFTSEESTVGRLTYSGPALMLGIMTNFY